MTESKTLLGLEVYEWHLEEDTQEVCPYFKGFAENEKVAKISKAVVELANNFNLGVHEEDIEEPSR